MDAFDSEVENFRKKTHTRTAIVSENFYISFNFFGSVRFKNC